MDYVKKYWGAVIVFLLSLIILIPLFHAGSFPVHDDTQASRVFEMAQSLKDGMFPVRWVKDLGFGYGYPIFNFYSPLPYYIGALFVLIGVNALLSAKIMMAIAIVTAGFAMYWFVRSFFDEFTATAAGVLYLFFPYFAVNIFVRGAVDEFFAYALLPLVFLGFFKIHYESQKKQLPLKWIITTSFFFALITLAHNLTAFMVGIILIFFFMFSLLFHKKRKTFIVSYFLVLLLTFLLSAFYALPAVFEMKYTDVISQTTGGFAYFNHFICPDQFWNSMWGFGGSTKGCLDGLSFRLGKSNVIFVLLAIITGIVMFLMKKRKEKQFLFLFFLFMLIFSLFMTTSFSHFIWHIIPVMSFIQFPWRFLDFVGLAMALLIGFLVSFVEYRNDKKIKIISMLIIIAGTLFLNAKLFRPQLYDTRTSSSYISHSALTFSISKITNEYMPKGFLRPQKESQVPKSPIDVVKGKGSVSIISNTTTHLDTDIHLKTPSEIRINRAPFPTWHYTVNGQSVPVHLGNDGVYIFLPPGTSQVSATFQQTLIEKIADILSLFGIILLIVGIILQRRKKYAKTS